MLSSCRLASGGSTRLVSRIIPPPHLFTGSPTCQITCPSRATSSTCLLPGGFPVPSPACSVASSAWMVYFVSFTFFLKNALLILFYSIHLYDQFMHLMSCSLVHKMLFILLQLKQNYKQYNMIIWRMRWNIYLGLEYFILILSLCLLLE